MDLKALKEMASAFGRVVEVREVSLGLAVVQLSGDASILAIAKFAEGPPTQLYCMGEGESRKLLKALRACVKGD